MTDIFKSADWAREVVFDRKSVLAQAKGMDIHFLGITARVSKDDVVSAGLSEGRPYIEVNGVKQFKADEGGSMKDGSE